jgi:peptidase E
MSTPATTPAPIYLFADSQLFFWNDRGTLFMQSVRKQLGPESPAAAYVGASNGDSPEAHQIFVEAMQTAGIQDHRHIRSSLPPEDEAFLRRADLIVLSGGDVEAGWNVFSQTGMKDLILERRAAGALLIGVSAGAVQLGRHGLISRGEATAELIESFQLVPFIIGVHDENHDWDTLRRAVQLLEGTAQGIGIPAGGGLICHPDDTVEAIRRPLHEFTVRDGKPVSSMIFPPE